MQFALLNLAMDSKLRASDLLKLHFYDVSSLGVIYSRVADALRLSEKTDC
ncbi:integrase [Vibrio owensii]|nr:integrase [Vibrio owensii]